MRNSHLDPETYDLSNYSLTPEDREALKEEWNSCYTRILLVGGLIVALIGNYYLGKRESVESSTLPKASIIHTKPEPSLGGSSRLAPSENDLGKKLEPR